ncbi:MAG: tRNA dihydrouridine synthase DusB [Terrimicrobiaceae bacterium]
MNSADGAGGIPCPPLFLAPMAGVTNTVFRRICREMGADVLTSEFVSAEGIMHKNPRTKFYIEFHESERPLWIQLFGGNPERLAEAARVLIDWVQPDFLDLNFGCPVNKVVSKNGGSSLLRDCPLLARVASAVVKAAGPVPVTAKIRIGWDDQSINATQTASILADEGITRIAVHGRTKAQGYTGLANWDVIADVAAAVSVPVIGNGDIRTGEDAISRFHNCGVAGLMIGRAAMANPWIFSEIRAAVAGVPFLQPSPEDRWKLILRHCQEEVAWRGDELSALKSMRARLMAYTRGMPGGPRLRERLARVASRAELEDIATLALGDTANEICSTTLVG